DRRLEEIRDTEFGLPPSNYEGRFGNGAPFALFIGEVLIKLQSILSLYRRPLRFFAPSDAVPQEFRALLWRVLRCCAPALAALSARCLAVMKCDEIGRAHV